MSRHRSSSTRGRALVCRATLTGARAEGYGPHEDDEIYRRHLRLTNLSTKPDPAAL